ncbi:galectin-6-like [Protobothrops mucrosquamatus]|uniref:galectin-6-like n=1 Tax=Protobothrops mucrosquamatus TaxID=103944 RepID=UPI0010FAD259|nr:galectin-6-like [Protobothrops mucrosquamatus]
MIHHIYQHYCILNQLKFPNDFHGSPIETNQKEDGSEMMGKIMNALEEYELEKLMNMDKDQNDIPELMLIRKKITPIIKKAEVGEGLSKLINGNDEKRKKTLPYHHSVPGGLHTGMSIYVQGTVPKHVKRFCVYFACCHHEGADVTFHFSPQFDIDKTVLNTFWDGKWGKAEHHKMPFRKGEKFEIIFIVNNTGYQVLVNRNPLCTYRHRIPPQRVQDINVDGNLQLHSLIVMGGPTKGNMPVPYICDIPGGLKANRTITVRGSIPKNAKRFEIKFMAGQDIALSISPHLEKRTMVCNSFLNGSWEPEERNLLFNLFQSEKYFELSIHCDNHKFKIYANSQPFFSYAHRYVPIENIKTIKITGNVTLSYITY